MSSEAMSATAASESIEDIEIQLLLDAVYRHYHYDFRHYARASIKRRLLQARAQWGFDSISSIQSAVLHDETILPRLLNYVRRAGKVSSRTWPRRKSRPCRVRLSPRARARKRYWWRRWRRRWRP